MVKAPDRPSSYPRLQVDLPELRGYGELVDGLSTDLGTLSTQAEVFCRTSDFGRIVEEMTDDYATLLPQLKELFAENERVMGQYAAALDRTAVDYERSDDHAAESLGYTDGITGGSGSARFRPADPIDYTVSPYPTEAELPEVSFGFLFDRLAWALDTCCGWDVRAEVTELIAGDVVDLSTQAKCWDLISDRLASVRTTLGEGHSRIGESWRGYASSVHAIELIGWDTALQSQVDGLSELGTHLENVARDAVNTAQLVVDCIRLAVELIASAWALQYIPVYGQVKFVQKAWDAYKRASEATAYIRMLIATLRTVKSFIQVLVDELTPSILPNRPLSV